MKVLLIYVVTENLNMEVLPLGTAYIAASAEKAGHDVSMLNLKTTEGNHLSILKNKIDLFQPEVIGVSLRNIDDQSMKNTQFLLEPVREVVSACRKTTEAPVVIGGAGYSIFPESSLTYTGADMGIKGEGEAAFVMLLERLAAQKGVEDVPGLYLPGKGAMNAPRFPESLQDYTMPLPDIHLKIPRASKDNPTWVPIQTRRGCPMECSYCSTSTIEGRILRKHPVKKVVENMRQYVHSGNRHFFFVDNTFNFPSSYAEELCDRIISENLNIKARCIIYPKNVSEKLVDKMARAGFAEVSLGFESGCERILKSFNKRFSLEDVRRISHLFKERNIYQMGFLLLGGPGETKESVLESLEFVEGLDLDFIKVSVGIRIYPHTGLAERAIAEGRISSHHDLFHPVFYINEDIGKWLYETVSIWIKQNPGRMM